MWLFLFHPLKPVIMRKTMWLTFLLALSVLWLLPSCKGESKEEKAAREAQEAADQMEEAAQKMQDALTGIESGEKAEVVDWRKLKELLPNKIDGMPRTDESGETAGAMGFTFSQASGTFEKGDRRVDLKIVDTGGLSGLLSVSAAWTTITIDKEDRNGYERTTEIDGYKAFEKYDKNSKNGEVSVLVGKRFVVTLEGRGVDMDELRDALDDIGLKKLERLN